MRCSVMNHLKIILVHYQINLMLNRLIQEWWQSSHLTLCKKRKKKYPRSWTIPLNCLLRNKAKISFTAKKHCVILLNNWSRWGLGHGVNLYRVEIFTVARPKTLARTLSEVESRVKITSFQLNFGSMGFQRLGLDQRSFMEPFWVLFLLFFTILKQFPTYFACSGECYNTVLLH